MELCENIRWKMGLVRFGFGEVLGVGFVRFGLGVYEV